ncbi:MAG: hypothetical protein Q8N63_01700 [Nanoarchaeota archaeon]|nr:hypothetical protein [Nanoarchaeota archaeon]
MVTISSSIITALVGLLGVVFGTLIGHYFNQQLNLRNSRKDILFRKKLEYFEQLSDTIEKNIKMYKNSLSSIKSKSSGKAIINLINEMKGSRKNFKIMASPLYLDIRSVSKKVVDFVDIEKQIFNKFEEFEKRKPNNRDIAELEEKIESLKLNANKILNEMRSEIKI